MLVQQKIDNLSLQLCENARKPHLHKIVKLLGYTLLDASMYNTL